MAPTLDALVPLLRAIYGTDALPEPFDLLAEVLDARLKKKIAEPVGSEKVDRRTAARAKKVAALLAAPDALEQATGIASGAELPEKIVARAEMMLGQLLLGHLAEQAFELIYKNTMHNADLTLEDQRESRNDTDYRVLNGGRRQVFRMNIKFHGARFRNAMDMVGLEPDDCFALATYKIGQGLQKQEKEVLPYIFVVVSTPIASSDIGRQIPRRYVDLAALAHASKSIKGKRKIEERIIEHLVAGSDAGFAPVVQQLRDQLATATWRVLSARKADKLLREKLFDRVFAVRVRAFNRNYRNAELDMHFSLSQDMTPLHRFLEIIRDKGLHGVTAELERGTV